MTLKAMALQLVPLKTLALTGGDNTEYDSPAVPSKKLAPRSVVEGDDDCVVVGVSDNVCVDV